MQIVDVLVRYAIGIDERDWSAFRSCWMPEVLADYGDFGVFSDRDVITRAMQIAHDPMGPTYHRMSNLHVAVDGDWATARSFVHAVLVLSPDDPGSWHDVIGSYDDVFVRSEGGWRISRRRVHIGRTITSSQTFA
ncbi:nuclear transport factor 2 family protein [Streptomyces sp. NPDC057199]|uniref:nuclear transport factor 2 family protein n=1 Tax=Streptomyces sp. NPDC057199 TaxID=3346047 RepID=UPI003639AA6A